MKLFRSVNKPLIGICVPCRDMVHSAFASDLFNLLHVSSSSQYDLKLMLLQGSLISAQRQKLAELAISEGCSHIMWLDSDMGFPTNIIDALLMHKKPIVACNYSTRQSPFKGVAYKKVGDWDSWLRSQPHGLEIVEGVGMGCMLTDCAVFKDLPKPWFEITYHNEWDNHIGEDFYFCTKARANGYEIFIDLSMSKLIKHWGTSSFDETVWPKDN